MEDQCKDAIIEAIPAKRNQGKRPDGELIAMYVASKFGLDQNRAIVVIENLLTEAVVYFKVNKQGKDSFYVSTGSVECATQDESVVVFNDNSHESFEIPSTPSGEERQTNHLHYDQSCSKESRSFHAPFPSDMHSHPDSLQRHNGARSRTQNSAESGDIVSLVNIIGSMADSIMKLNAMLKSERNKAENLLNGNKSLKSRSHELQILTENLLHFQKFHSKLEIASSCKAFEIRSEVITDADRHHKDTESQISTTIQLSNNEKSKEEQHKRPNKAKRTCPSMQNQRMEQKHQQGTNKGL